MENFLVLTYDIFSACQFKSKPVASAWRETLLQDTGEKQEEIYLLSVSKTSTKGNERNSPRLQSPDLSGPTTRYQAISKWRIPYVCNTNIYSIILIVFSSNIY